MVLCGGIEIISLRLARKNSAGDGREKREEGAGSEEEEK
jgi:hypothetical protein